MDISPQKSLLNQESEHLDEEFFGQEDYVAENERLTSKPEGLDSPRANKFDPFEKSLSFQEESLLIRGETKKTSYLEANRAFQEKESCPELQENRVIQNESEKRKKTFHEETQ